MKKIFHILFKICLIILSILGTIAFGDALVTVVRTHFSNPGQLLFFLGGCGIFLLLWMVYFSRRQGFWSNLEHELTHALFALLFFKKVHTISASRGKGGIIRMEKGNEFIALAPYFFPLSSIIIQIPKMFIQSQYQVYLNVLLGFTYFFHLLNLFGEFHFQQSDIKETGPIFSTFLVLFLNILFCGIVVSSLRGEWGDIYSFLENGFMNARVLVMLLYTTVFRSLS